jgi:hypothetical protein
VCICCFSSKICISSLKPGSIKFHNTQGKFIHTPWSNDLIFLPVSFHSTWCCTSGAIEQFTTKPGSYLLIVNPHFWCCPDSPSYFTTHLEEPPHGIQFFPWKLITTQHWSLWSKHVYIVLYRIRIWILCILCPSDLIRTVQTFNLVKSALPEGCIASPSWWLWKINRK